MCNIFLPIHLPLVPDLRLFVMTGLTIRPGRMAAFTLSGRPLLSIVHREAAIISSRLAGDNGKRTANVERPGRRGETVEER